MRDKTMNIDEMIEVLQAMKEGKKILIRENAPSYCWRDYVYSDNTGGMNFVVFEFKVKPEPREFYVNIDRTGLYTHKTEKEAIKGKTTLVGHININTETIKVREVLEDD